MSIKDNFDFHDARVHNIFVDLEKYEIIINVTPYKKGMNYEGEKVEIRFINVTNIQIFEGSIKEGAYVYSLEEGDHKGVEKKYVISLNSDVHIDIICGEMIIG